MEKTKSGKKLIAANKKAFFNYQIVDKCEAGIVLTGCEVKSIRQGLVSIQESFAKFLKGELWLFNCHINPYKEGNRFNEDPLRDRKLLLHKSEINRWLGKVNEKGLSLIPLSLYFFRGKAKIELGLCKGKKLHDKRASLKEKAIKRDLERGE